MNMQTMKRPFLVPAKQMSGLAENFGPVCIYIVIARLERCNLPGADVDHPRHLHSGRLAIQRFLPRKLSRGVALQDEWVFRLLACPAAPSSGKGSRLPLTDLLLPTVYA